MAERMSKKGRREVKKRIAFKVNAEAGKQVFVAGAFNDWQPVKELVDKQGTGEYVGILMLTPGIYEYKFVIDGEWRLDESNPNFKPNSMGTLNSILEVKK